MGPYWVFATVPVTVRDGAGLLAPVIRPALAFLLAVGPAELDPAPFAIGCDVMADADGGLAARGAPPPASAS